MLDALIDFSVRQKFVVLLLTAAMALAGLYSLSQLAIDAVPDITNNQVQVVTVSQTLATQEVEQFVTYPVELAMANLQGVSEIRSVSRYGLSVVTIVFHDDIPILQARQLVSEKLQTLSGQIPADMGRPELMPITTGLGEIYQYTIDILPGYEGRYTAMDLRTVQDWIVKRQLAGIPGVVEISSFGGFLKQYEVAIRPEVLRNYDLTIQEVFDALATSNRNTGGSYIEKDAYAYYVRAEGLLKSVDEIRAVVVHTVNGVPLRIGDIAEVRMGYAPRFGAMTKDGKGEAVGGIVLMLKGANASQVADLVKTRMAIVQKSLPEGLRVVPYLDRSDLVGRVIRTVGTNLVEGGLIVIFVLVLLLGNWRAGLVVASVIPLAMLFAVTLMHIFGVSANLMSLGAIDFGLVVDGAVIIVEAIIHRLHLQYPGLRIGQAQMDDAVSDSAKRIRQSAAFGEIIIMIVYLPILTLIGIEGKMFKPMALTVSFAIFGALILSLTYVPMMSAFMLSRQIHTGQTFADRIMGRLQRLYDPLIRLALRRRTAVVTSAVAMFGGSLWLFGYLGAVFVPNLEEGDLAMQMSIPPGASLQQTVHTATRAEQILLKNFPEVRFVVSKIGTAEVPTDPMAVEDADVMIVLKPKDQWTSADNREALADLMKQKLSAVLGASFEFTQPIQLRFNELMTGSKADIALKIYGEDLNVLFDKANEAAELIRAVPGAADIKVQQIEGLPQLIVRYDRSAMARYGLTISELNTAIRAAMAGESAGLIYEGVKKFDLVVRLDPEKRKDLQAIEQLYVKTPAGAQIPLSEVARISIENGPMLIPRENTQRLITVGINVRNRDVKSLVQEIQGRLDRGLRLPSGYFIHYGGQFEHLEAASARLMIAVPGALALIFVLLYFTFGSVRQSLLIFSAIPLSAIGGVLALWLRGMPFSISAGVGFIALFGVAVLNGIVMIGYLNQLKREGWQDVQARVLEGTAVRLRPVIMTAAVASLGFLPMALSTGSGAEVQQPLATVVIGGLVSATCLTLIVLPVLYAWTEEQAAH